jgi:UDP-glucose 4-epimerase
MNWHPAQKLSVLHHADRATACELALTGAMDSRIVNIADEAPLTIYEIAQIVGSTYESSAEPLTNPWKGHMDVTLRSLGFQPKVPTVYQAIREGKL